ncbi:beta family protein [Rhodopseudomonas palustris]|uniref:Beta family protein n=1 Tax=Rhodopseudomonas palustris TaxID=1076 RepID=A0AAX3E2M2_RHOPL|nr:beta family protein [Rhodopseudomonas palustris]UYO41002.1 beta family protein [Rhodopseudomonas palustris]
MLATSEQFLKQSLYAPKLPFKKGEIAAFKSAPTLTNNQTVPIFVIPPAGSFDHDAEKVLSPADHIRVFGPRIWEARRDRPVFVDAVYLDDERHRAAFNVHPLTALLERARLNRAKAWPVTSYGRSDDYQAAVAKAHLSNGVPVAIQIRLADLGAASLSMRLQNLCNQVSCNPGEAVLLIDCGPLFFADQESEEEFADGLIQAINQLPNLHDWCQIVLSATSLGDIQKVKPNQERLFRRSEWHIYRRLVARSRELLRRPIFSDYGTEYREDLTPIKARPSAKLNYTTESAYFYVKGENVATGGYEAIYSVAEKVAASDHFLGPELSVGDARLLLLSQRLSPTGNAPTWRWICADHHLAVVFGEFRKLYGLQSVVEAPPLQQLELFGTTPAK